MAMVMSNHPYIIARQTPADYVLSLLYRQKYLFENNQPGVKFFTKSIQDIFTPACQKAETKIHATVQPLMHSFVAHLHESAPDLRIIQEIIGYSSFKTTEIHTHVSTTTSKIRSLL